MMHRQDRLVIEAATSVLVFGCMRMGKLTFKNGYDFDVTTNLCVDDMYNLLKKKGIFNSS